MPAAYLDTITAAADKVTVTLQRRYQSAAGGAMTEDKTFNDSNVTRTLTNDGKGNYTYKFTTDGVSDNTAGTALPKYSPDGTLYQYYVKENNNNLSDGGPAMSTVYNTTVNDFLITNTYDTTKDNVKDITVTKDWANLTEAQKKIRPAIKFTLQRSLDGSSEWTDVGTKTLDRNSTDTSVTFEKCLLYAPNGTKFNYRVTEDITGIYGYAATYKIKEGDAAESGTTADLGTDNNSVTFTNTYDAQKVALTGTKAWDDYSNQYGIRPAAINLTLTRSQGSDVKDENVTLQTTNADAANYLNWTNKGSTDASWAYSIANLDRIAPNGKPYTYKVTEAVPEGYKSPAAGQSATCSADSDSAAVPEIKNTLADGIKLVKNWDDGDDRYGFRPASITVKLQQKIGSSGTWTDFNWPGESTAVKEIDKTKATVAGNTWTWAFSGSLPAKSGTDVCTYRLVETKIGSVDVSSDIAGTYRISSSDTAESSGTYTTTVKNELRRVGLNVVKTWAGDSEDAYDTRPEAVTFTLQRSTDGTTWANAKKGDGLTDIKVTVNKAGSWKGAFTDLPAYDGSGSKYYYKAIETSPNYGTGSGQNPTYVSTYSDTKTDGETAATSTCTNTLQNGNKTVTATKIWHDGKTAHPEIKLEAEKEYGQYELVIIFTGSSRDTGQRND